MNEKSVGPNETAKSMKRAYERPVLSELGSISELTLNAPGTGGFDAGPFCSPSAAQDPEFDC